MAGISVSQVASELTRVGRTQRAPRHDFQVRHRPWEIQPFMIAPVLPGDTLKSAKLQARAITDSIRNPLVGFWLEHHLYYVKLTDMEDCGIVEEGLFRNFLINPAGNLEGSAVWLPADNNDGSPAFYRSTVAQFDFVSVCLATVVNSYFRDEEEDAIGSWNFNEAPLARIAAPGRDSWLQSLMKDDTEVNPGILTGAAPDDPNVASQYQEFYDRMVMMGATDLTYEDWLRSFGIKGEVVRRPGRPELIRYVRSWQYPSSHVDAATGAVNSVVSWGIDENVDKQRFFKEPGFIFGVTLARPKVYLSKQTSVAAMLMGSPFAWLPATLRDKPELALQKIAAGHGPLSHSTAGYWIDISDLFMYGDQFVNFDLTTAGSSAVAHPANDLSEVKQRWYPSDADIEGIFSSAADTGVRDGRLVKQDGTCSLHILSAVKDNT